VIRIELALVERLVHPHRSEPEMGLDNPLHIAFLLVILLLVFGAKRLPELGRSLGTGMRSFKESISGESHTPEHREEITPSPASTLPVAESVVERAPIRPVA
jgi:sec-independent protein translocase protein TatA